ncbi:MAG: response regulator [Candidatus Pacebacteria bacterium]|nr:response regulator [Candidatus Paceibacterota bacterium]
MARILLVEDEVFLSSLLKNRFQKEGFEVVLAQTGDEALTALSGGQKPDLILLDLILPGKSGFEVLETIKSDPRVTKVPVMIISNLGQDSDIQKGKELGAVDYLIKTRVSIDFLVERAKEFLKQSPVQQ